MSAYKNVPDTTTMYGRRAACGYYVNLETCSACRHCDKVHSTCKAHDFGVNQDRGKCNDYADRNKIKQ